ncbi:helix-turn-helix transcriptional regulator [Burkholderia cenocepacia]|uniref:helix-turn-helix transcriptional regulator n=1 Tax=Burkholderia cenocepacia TaxID=95486 RepID=UPI001904FF41|nr:helix-turn-helix transcriptional regulator [Burkholderia cenocepacia]MBJ9898875.1 helix-turn-helix transcriptional regulator [Burkholderia cenocepacia]
MTRDAIRPRSIPPRGAALARRVGRLLLPLYRLPQATRVDEFDRRLLLLLNEHIDVDGAWFGHSSLRPDGPLPHSAYLHNLRPGFMHDWEQVKLRDPLARLAETSSEKIVVASTSTVPLNDTMRRFCKAQGIAQVLFAVCVDAGNQRATHLSLYRRTHRRFDAADANLLELAIEHMASALECNRLHWMHATDGATGGAASALFDAHGVLQYADDAFLALAALEWPSWDRTGLPDDARARLFDATPPPPALSGARIRLHSERLGDYVLVRARAAGVGAVLSPRELAVARIFCDGCTYKGVAKRLGIAPATARHHLRRVYVKLRVTTKSELIRVLDDDGALA